MDGREVDHPRPFVRSGPDIPGLLRDRRTCLVGRGRIRRVDVSADGGASWAQAALTGPVLPQALTAFRIPWRWSGAPTTLMSRATDETGAVQPLRAAWLASHGTGQVYHNNAVQGWGVDARGRIAHVYS